jgi:hypothetical protein
VLIDERASNQIVEREPNGQFKVIAGNGRAGFKGDGGSASAAELDSPGVVAVSPNGTAYVADLGNDRIRAIAPDGVISTAAHVSQPGAVAVGPNGVVDVLDQSGIQSINGQGDLVPVATPTMVAPGTPGFPYGANSVLTVDGTSIAYHPSALAVSSSGDIYVANFSPKVVIRFPPSGPPSLVGQSTVGSGEMYVSALTAGPDGTIVEGDFGAWGIDQVTRSNVHVVWSFALRTVPGLNGAFRPSGVSVAPNGEIYAATDGVNGGTNMPALLSIDPDGQVTKSR